MPTLDQDGQAQWLLAGRPTPSAAFLTPKARVFRWKVMPFNVANAPALFQVQMNKILGILGRRPLVQELVSRGGEMEAHISTVSLGANTQEDYILLLQAWQV